MSRTIATLAPTSGLAEFQNGARLAEATTARPMRGHILFVVLAGLALQGCSAAARLDPQPEPLTTKAVVLDTPNVRFYPDAQTEEIFEEALRSGKRRLKFLNLKDLSELPPSNLLAISGGGDDGAFGAGLLVGWTKAGTRPEFGLVTGISTGALIAPFAFLGPDYDEKLKAVYTEISADDIYFSRGLTAALFDDALSDTTPLFDLISKFLDEEMLAAITREYEKGRLLFIGTTNLDARRAVIWNIGAITASGHPGAADLVRKILLASSAIPAAFPPVMIDVEIDGTPYQEMHVDGGAIAQLFLYPSKVGEEVIGLEKSMGFKRERHAYIIRNGRLGSDWSVVERRTLDIAGRAISAMIYSSGVNDLFRIYFITQRDGVEYNLAFIEEDFEPPEREGDFDPAYMEALFTYGYEKGRQGYQWRKAPPFLE